MLRFGEPPINYKWGCKNCLRVGFVNGREPPIGFTSSSKISRFAEPRLSSFPSVATMVSFSFGAGNTVLKLSWYTCVTHLWTLLPHKSSCLLFFLSRVSDRCERDNLLSRLRWLLLCRRPPASLQLRCHSRIKGVDRLHGGVCVGVVAWSVCLLYNNAVLPHWHCSRLQPSTLKACGPSSTACWTVTKWTEQTLSDFAAEILSVMSRQTACRSDLTPVALLHPAQRLVSSEDQRELANKTFWFKAQSEAACFFQQVTPFRRLRKINK